jgi:hypothetical protein
MNLDALLFKSRSIGTKVNKSDHNGYGLWSLEIDNPAESQSMMPEIPERRRERKILDSNFGCW